MHRIGSRRSTRLRDHLGLHGNISGINAQFAIGIEGKAKQRTGRILQPRNDQLARRRKMKLSGLQLRNGGLIRVDVKSLLHVQRELHFRVLTGLYNHRGNRFYGDAAGSRYRTRALRKRRQAQSQTENGKDPCLFCHDHNEAILDLSLALFLSLSLSKEAVPSPPRAFLMLSTITLSLTRPIARSTTLPLRSTKKLVGRPSTPPY